MKKSFTIIVGLCLLFAAAPSQAYWTGAGDGTSWSDVANWSDTVVPLTAGGANNATVNANAEVTTVNLDGDAITLVDTTSSNFLSTRAEDSARTLNFNANWGTSGFQGNAMWAGQNTSGVVNFNSNAGALTLTGGGYLGRGSVAGGVLNFNVNGGSVAFKEVSVGCRSDALAEIALNATGGTLYLGQSGATDVVGTIMGRSQHGAYLVDQTVKVSIGGNATVFTNDTRMGALSGGQGLGIFEVIGSNATIRYDHDFHTHQSGSFLGDTLIRFVADAGGVSTITAYDADATLRIDNDAILEVDISAYEGTGDLVLFSYNRHVGGTFGTVDIIGGQATLVYDNTGATYDNTNVGSIYLTDICIGLSANLTTGDCTVDMADFAVLASNWLACNAADCP